MSTSPPTTRRSAAEQARFETELTELYEHRITFNQTLGLKVESAAAPAPRIRFEMRPELVGHYLYGRLHGGVIASALDVMGSFALMVALADKHADETAAQVMHRFGRLGTIDLRVDYLSPGLGAWFVASAEVSRLGGRIGSTQMRLVSDQGLLVATASAAYVVS